METYNKDIHGEVLHAYTYSQFYMRSVSLFYVLISVFAIVLPEYIDICDYFFTGSIILFSLWRIYRVHRNIVIACEKKILFNVPMGVPGWKNMAFFQSMYMSFDYDEIVGVSDDWAYLFLGERVDGGIVEAPIQIKFVSKENKKSIQEWIQKKKRENE